LNNRLPETVPPPDNVVAPEKLLLPENVLAPENVLPNSAIATVPAASGKLITLLLPAFGAFTVVTKVLAVFLSINVLT
jgi:hypothetical protein